VKNFVINTHHRPEAFRDFFSGGSYRGHPVQLVHEEEVLGTGGGIKNIEDLLGREPFVVYSGDILTDIDLARLIAEHESAANDVTLALRETHLGKDIAIEGKRVVDLESRFGQPGRYDFAGISVWTPAIFERLPAGESVSFIPYVAEWIGQGGRVGGVVLNEGKWFNIGSRREYLAVHRRVATENWKPAYLPESDWPVQIAPDARIDSTARLSGFYSIGAGCFIGAEATIEDTILWPGAQIASRSYLRNCIVRSHQTAQGTLRDTDI
jgi:NDP-sugar pyrophosphorylase family protein